MRCHAHCPCILDKNEHIAHHFDTEPCAAVRQILTVVWRRWPRQCQQGFCFGCVGETTPLISWPLLFLILQLLPFPSSEWHASLQCSCYLSTCLANPTCSGGLQTLLYKMFHWILKRRSLLDERHGSQSKSASAGYLYRVYFNITSTYFVIHPLCSGPLKSRR